jgi:hypothetical protein
MHHICFHFYTVTLLKSLHMEIASANYLNLLEIYCIGTIFPLYRGLLVKCPPCTYCLWVLGIHVLATILTELS